MKKMMLTFAGLLLVQSMAFAQDASYRKLKDAEMFKYRASLVHALAGEIVEDCMSVIQGSTEMYVQEGSAQPLIIAVEDAGKKYAKKTVKITTDSSYQKIVNVEGQSSFESTIDVEKGDFRNPNLVQEKITYNTKMRCYYRQ